MTAQTVFPKNGLLFYLYDTILYLQLVKGIKTKSVHTVAGFIS